MKRYIFPAVLAVAALVSCGRSINYEYKAFVTLDAAVYSVDETVGEITIPVTIYNPTGAEVKVTVSSENGKAVESKDYEVISPASGILTFSGETVTQDIVVEIIPDRPALTGSKDFSISIASVSPELELGNCSKASIKIKDVDHPLAAFIGIWSASATGYSENTYNWEITIEGVEDNYEKLIVSNLDPMTANFYGLTADNGYNIFDATVSSDKTQLIVERDQFIGTAEEDDLLITGLDSPRLETAMYYADIVFTISQDQKTMGVENAWGILGTEGLWEVYPGGVVFTKK